MSIVLDKPGFVPMSSLLDDMDNQFPDTLYVTSHKPSGTHGCYCVGNVHGLAVFSTALKAAGFSDFVNESPLDVIELSLEEALDLAKTKPYPVVCIHLLDEMSNPKTIYVK
jgi:hypothetical protein